MQTQVQKSQDTLSTVRNTIKLSEPHDLVTKHTELERNVKLLSENKTGTDIDINPVVEISKFVLKPFTLGCISQIRKFRCELANEFGDFRGAAFITVTSSGLVAITDYTAKQVIVYSLHSSGQFKKTFKFISFKQ